MSTNSKPNWVKGTVLMYVPNPGVNNIIFEEFSGSSKDIFYCSEGAARFISQWTEVSVTPAATAYGTNPLKELVELYQQHKHAMLYGKSSMKISYDHLDKVSVNKTDAHSCSNHLQSYTGFIESYKFCSVCDKKYR